MRTSASAVAVMAVGTLVLLGASPATAQPRPKDTQPPTLHHLFVTPAVVDAGSEVTVTIHVTDDLSGLEDQPGYVRLMSPTQREHYDVRVSHVSDNLYEGTVALSQFAERGPWLVEYVFLVDVAGNLKSYAGDTKTVFTIRGNLDLPVLASKWNRLTDSLVVLFRGVVPAYAANTLGRVGELQLYRQSGGAAAVVTSQPSQPAPAASGGTPQRPSNLLPLPPSQPLRREEVRKPEAGIRPTPRHDDDEEEERERQRREFGKWLMEQGKKALTERDVLLAFEQFQAAQQIFNDTDPEANFYVAVTRLLAQPGYHRALFESLGFKGPNRTVLRAVHLSPFQFRALAPGAIAIPSSLASGEQIRRRLLRNLEPALRASLNDLERLPTGFSSSLPVTNPLTGAKAIEIDDADVWLIRSIIHVSLAHLALTQLYNVNVDVKELVERAQAGQPLDYQEALRRYPAALRIQDLGASLTAKSELIASVHDYLEADIAMHAESDDQQDDLFSYSLRPDDAKNRHAFHKTLREFKGSLEGLSPPAWSLTLDQLNLGYFFSRPLDLRSLEDGRGVQEALVTHLRGHAEYALRNLRKAPVRFSQVVEARTYGLPLGHGAREIDYGDLLALQGALEGLHGAMDILASYNLDGSLLDIAQKSFEHHLDVTRDLKDRFPSLLTVKDLTGLGQAREATKAALASFLATSDYMRLDDDANQQDDLLDLNDLNTRQRGVDFSEPHWRPQISQLRQSLKGTIDPDPTRKGDEFLLDLAPAFEGKIDLRNLLPRFVDIHLFPLTFPDPTFRGLLPGMTQDRLPDWERKLPEELRPPKEKKP